MNTLFLEASNAHFEGIKKAIIWLYWWIIEGITKILDLVSYFFTIFTGNAFLKTDGEPVQFNILESFFIQGNIVKIYSWLALAAFVIMLLFSIITVIKQDYFDKQEPKSKGPLILNIFLGFLLFIFMVPIAIFGVSLISKITETVSLLLTDESVYGSIEGSSDGFLKGGSFYSNSLIEAAFDSFGFEGNLWKSMQPFVETVTEEVDGILVTTNVSNGLFKEGVNFHWHLLLVGAIFVTWNLLSMVIILVKRIFNIIILYLTAPFEIASMVADDGIRFRKWKDKMVAQLMSVVAVIIAFLVFNLLISISTRFNNVVIEDNKIIFIENVEGLPNIDDIPENPLEDEEREIVKLGGVIYIIIMMGGSVAVKKVTEMFMDGSDEKPIIFKDKKSVQTTSSTTPKKDTSTQSKPRTITRTITRDSSRTITRGSSGGGGAPTYSPPPFIRGDRGGGPSTSQSRATPSHTPSKPSVSIPTRNVSSIKTRVSSTTSRGNLSSGNYILGGASGKYNDSQVSTITSAGYRASSSSLDVSPVKWSQSNEASIKSSASNYIGASMQFDSTVTSNTSHSNLQAATRKYLDAAKKEKVVIKKEIVQDQKDVKPKLSTLTSKQKESYRRVNTNYQKAQTHYQKTTSNLSNMISKSNPNTLEIIKMKEKADKQRQKLMAATSSAKKFYKEIKGGK